MDEVTAQIYVRRAHEWQRLRGGAHGDRARALGARVRPGGIRLDLGCGPGFHLTDLGAPVVAVDVAGPMLELARQRSPDAGLVQADLEALPFRPGSFAAVWAAKSYLHVPSTSLPLALAELHRATETAGPLELLLRAGTFEGRLDTGDFPGRFFAEWEPMRLRDVVEGAGFDLEILAEEDRWIRVLGTRSRSLPDTVGPGMRLLVCGLNPSEYAADAGVGFARPGNRFWPAAVAAGLVEVARDPLAALRRGLGMTDLIKRATPRADGLTRSEYEAGLARVERMVRWLEPGAVCFVGLAGWRSVVDRSASAGVVRSGFGGRPAYVMPSTSGANASSSLEDLVAHLRAAAALAADRS